MVKSSDLKNGVFRFDIPYKNRTLGVRISSNGFLLLKSLFASFLRSASPVKFKIMTPKFCSNTDGRKEERKAHSIEALAASTKRRGYAKNTLAGAYSHKI